VRIRLVVNRAASSVTAAGVERVRIALAVDHDVVVSTTDERGHATELAADAVAEGTDCVAVLGGDGTMNEVVAALAGTRVALAPLPGGSTSVFARTLGHPRDPVAAAGEVARALRRGSIERIGLGDVDGRPFVCHTGIGWDAALVAEVERRAAWKRHATTALFGAAAVHTFLSTYDRSRPHFRVRFGPGVDDLVDDAYFTLVLNSDPYTFVGPRPFTVAPTADLHRPFSVVTVRRLELLPFLGLVARSLWTRRGLLTGPDLDVRTDVRALTARRRTTMPYQVDGDHLGDADELHLSHRPDALDVVVPLDRSLRSGRGPGGPPPARW
jgi:diacylglycerol kinase family enzyme